MANLTEKTADSAKPAQALSKVGIALSYGDKVVVDGVELVPVALASYGFGEGNGSDGTGTGSGGGGMSIPVGAYVKGPDGVRFRPNLIALIAVSIPFVCAAGWALSKIIKALKK